jgi:hypothetical protein
MLSATVQADAITAAAKKWNVPVGTLAGVYGIETAFGTNHNTSTAGAVGDFQFLPSTAKSYAYPTVNDPNAAQFGAQASGAAHYLSDLFHQTGSWDTALQHYSGGGYGLAEVNAKAAATPAGLKQALGLASLNAAGTTGNIPGAAPGPATPSGVVNGVASSIPDAITGAIGTLTADAKYSGVMIGILILGAMLIFRAFSGGGGKPKMPMVIPA